MLLFILSFVAGMLTVLAPCILPLLPIIIGGSLSGEGGHVNLRKVLTVIVALCVSIILFTLLLKASTLFISIPTLFWKWVSGGIVVLFGLVTLFPRLWEGGFLSRVNVASNKVVGEGTAKDSFWGNIMIGAALGPVFSTCSPTYFVVLATVLPASPALGLLYLLTYAIGLSVSLFAIAFIGQKLLGRLGAAVGPNSMLKRILGVIFLVVGVAIITGLDKQLEGAIISTKFFDVTAVEQQLLDLSSKSYKESR